MVYSVSKEKAWIYINNISVFVFFSFFLLEVYTGSSLFYALNMFIVPVYLMQGIKKNEYVIFECLALLLLYAMFALVNCRTQNLFAGIFFDLQYIFMALLLCQKNISPKVFLLGLFVVLLLFAPRILGGVNPNELLKGGSRNVVSAIAINQTALYYAVSYVQKKKCRIFPALLNAIFCLLCIGRSGIIVSAMIFAGTFACWFMHKSARQRVFIFLTLIVLLLVLKNRIEALLPSLKFVENFNRVGFASAGRDAIKAEYFKIIGEDAWSLLFGIKDIDSNFVFRRFDGNLHNSLLTLHTYYSLLGGMLVVFLSVVGIVLCCIRFEFFIPWLLICVYLRVSKDIMAFPGFMDPVIYFCIFLTFSNYRRTKYLSFCVWRI